MPDFSHRFITGILPFHGLLNIEAAKYPDFLAIYRLISAETRNVEDALWYELSKSVLSEKF